MQCGASFQAFPAARLAEEQRLGALILDTRAAERFGAFHLRGAMQVSLMGPFASWSAMLIKPTQKVILVAEDWASAEEAQCRLARVGLENVTGYASVDELEWRRQGLEVGTLPVYLSRDISRDLPSYKSLRLVDVRSRAEWLKGHLPGAVCFPLLDVASGAPLAVTSTRTLLYCNEGYRATTAASIFLRQEDRNNICVLADGFDGWLASGLPLHAEDESSTEA